MAERKHESEPWWTRIDTKAPPIHGIERLIDHRLAVVFAQEKNGNVVCHIRGDGRSCVGRSTLWRGTSGPDEQDAKAAFVAAVANMRIDIEASRRAAIAKATTHKE